MENSATPAAPKKRLTRPLWIALLMLGFAGQLAWAVEINSSTPFSITRSHPTHAQSAGWWRSQHWLPR